jgi:hypothetical protein
MNSISISKFKLLSTAQIKELAPVEITADGDVIGVFSVNGEKADTSQIPTKCPNCKMVYKVSAPDNVPFFFSLQR